MAKSEVDKVTEEKIAKGGILAKLYFDLQNTDKEKLQPLMVDLINERLMKEPGMVYCYGAIEEPIEKKGVFMTSGTITVLFDNIKPLVGVAFKYAPAGIEVLRPEKGMHLKAQDIQAILMDLSQISIEYSKMILEKVMTPDEREAMARTLEGRVERGKKMMDESKKEKPPSN